MFLRVAFLGLAIGSLVACGAPESDAVASSEMVSEAYATCTTFQKSSAVLELSDEAKAEKVAAFVGRNGAAWSAADTALGRFGFVRSSKRTDAVGPAKELSVAALRAAGKAFLVKNWEQLGYRSEAAPAGLAGGFIGSTRGDDGTQMVQFDTHEVQPEYQHIVGADQWLRFRVYIGVDGEVRRFEQYAGLVDELLTMAPKPEKPTSFYRDLFNGVTLPSGTTIGPHTELDLEEYRLRTVVDAGGQVLLLRFLMQDSDGVVYRWDIDSCSGRPI